MWRPPVATNRPDPLTQTAFIVEETKNGLVPSSFFIRQWNLLLAFVSQTIGDITALIAQVAALAASVARLLAVNITTTAPISGGGSIIDLDPISHNDSGVTPGTYGDGSNVPQVTVDAKGHVDSVTLVPITGGGGDAYFLSTTSYFNYGANGQNPATAGLKFTPSRDITVKSVQALFNTDVVGATYVAKISSINSGLVIQAVLATSPSQVSTITTTSVREFVFATPVTLTAGVDYAITITRTDSTTTPTVLLGTVNATVQFPIPGVTFAGVLTLASVNPVAGNTFTSPAVGSNRYSMGLVWR